MSGRRRRFGHLLCHKRYRKWSARWWNWWQMEAKVSSAAATFLPHFPSFRLRARRFLPSIIFYFFSFVSLIKKFFYSIFLKCATSADTTPNKRFINASRKSRKSSWWAFKSSGKIVFWLGGLNHALSSLQFFFFVITFPSQIVTNWMEIKTKTTFESSWRWRRRRDLERWQTLEM